MHPTEGKPTVEVILTILHAGGKFGGGGYAVAGGLHGVGSTVVNALSERLEVEVRRDGYVWTMDFDRGVPNGELQRGEATDETGTTVTFWPDGSIFETTDFSYEYLRARFQQMAFLNKGLKISLTDERHNEVDDEDVQIDEDEANEWKPRTVTRPMENSSLRVPSRGRDDPASLTPSWTSGRCLGSSNDVSGKSACPRCRRCRCR